MALSRLRQTKAHSWHYRYSNRTTINLFCSIYRSSKPSVTRFTDPSSRQYLDKTQQLSKTSGRWQIMSLKNSLKMCQIWELLNFTWNIQTKDMFSL